jgi:translation initiation factor IF-2
MSKVRINDLARELEVKSNSILDALKAVGVTEKKTHSSSIEDDEAEKVRGHFHRGTRTAAKPSVEKPRLDLSNISKPGDFAKAILERKQAEAAARNAPQAAPPAVARPAFTVAAPSGARPPITVASPARPATASAPPAQNSPATPAAQFGATSTAPAPRRIVPIPRPPAPTYTVAPAGAAAGRATVGVPAGRAPAGATV